MYFSFLPVTKYIWCILVTSHSSCQLKKRTKEKETGDYVMQHTVGIVCSVDICWYRNKMGTVFHLKKNVASPLASDWLSMSFCGTIQSQKKPGLNWCASRLIYRASFFLCFDTRHKLQTRGYRRNNLVALHEAWRQDAIMWALLGHLPTSRAGGTRRQYRVNRYGLPRYGIPVRV